jgi:branched-chain amino acid aminotransferase
MTEPLAFLDGQYLPRSQMQLVPHDAGFVFGATITDFCRTFAHRLYRWQDHLTRFVRGCSLAFIDLWMNERQLTEVADELIAHNANLISPTQELALLMFATPGPLATLGPSGGSDGPATIGMHTTILSRERYRRFFTQGVALKIVGHHGSQRSDLALPEIKHRSRLHWWRADRLLRKSGDVQSVPLLLDAPHGQFTETAIGNVILAKQGKLFTPRRGMVLDSISLRVVYELCSAERIELHERDLSVEQLLAADEVMLAGSAFCLAGVSSVDDHDYAWPGAMTQKLLRLWSEEVGVDIQEWFQREQP